MSGAFDSIPTEIRTQYVDMLATNKRCYVGKTFVVLYTCFRVCLGTKMELVLPLLQMLSAIGWYPSVVIVKSYALLGFTIRLHTVADEIQYFSTERSPQDLSFTRTVDSYCLVPPLRNEFGWRFNRFLCETRQAGLSSPWLHHLLRTFLGSNWWLWKTR